MEFFKFKMFRKKPVKKERTQKRPLKIKTSGTDFETKLERQLGNRPSRLDGDFQETVITGSINRAIRAGLQQLQNESRTLAVNTPHGKRAAQYQSDNVVGKTGINPQPQIIRADGSTDIELNLKIKSAFEAWATRGRRFALDRSFGWREFQEVIERARFVDGESFIRLHEEDTLRIEVIESERVDVTHQFDTPETYCYMGIEYSKKSNAPVRYWIKKINYLTQTANGELEGVDADDVIHYYRKFFPNQMRGIPEATSALTTLIQYEAFKTYTLVQKKAAASTMGFITEDKDSQEQLDLNNLNGDDEEEPEEIVQELQAGVIQKLPQGHDIKQLTSTQGGDDFISFTNRLENHIAMGFGFFEQGYRGDTSSINYSSARFGDQSQRVMFSNVQRLMQERVLDVIYERWLQSAVLNDEIPISMTMVSFVLNNTDWSYPRWDSIDPKKEIETDVLKIENGLVSRKSVISSYGEDPSVVMAEVESEKDLHVPKQQAKIEVAKAPALAASENSSETE